MLTRIVWLILAAWLVCSARVVVAQEATPLPEPPAPPTGERFEEMLCRMAVGNVQERVQDHFGLYVELYFKPDGTQKTASSYGLLTGTYYGPRGISGHGPTLDAPGSERYLKDGHQLTNAETEHLRAVTSAFRQGACDERVEPTS